MNSITSASTLLATGSRTELLASLGFAPARTLDAVAQERLALPPTVEDAAVARGDGALRALVVTLSPDAHARDTLAKIAAKLSSRVPHLLWLLIATQRNTSLLTIATWRAALPTPQVAALVTYRDRIVESDAETLCTLTSIDTSATPEAADLLRHARWFDILGREAVTSRFYRALHTTTKTLASSLASPLAKVPQEDAATIALLYVSRLLFLSFLETKGWLNNDFAFLMNGFVTTIANGGDYHRKVLLPLFFGTLNTRPTERATRAHAFGKIPFLNGGLFARTPLERRFPNATFDDDALGTLYEYVLCKFRFTPHEESTTWSEAAIDPEMLGKAFESLMAADQRRSAGAYFTPQPLVERITTSALVEALHNEHDTPETIRAALAGYTLSPEARGRLLDRTTEIRILDPACGSGAFLVHALETVAKLRAHLGDPIPISAIRRQVLTRSIFGVDLHPTAVWLCELRLWLSVMIDSEEQDPMRVLPLPNLDHQIRIGDSLAGGTFNTPIDAPTARTITALRERYARANGPKKRTLARLLDRTERQRALATLDRELTSVRSRRRDVVTGARSPDLFHQRDRSASTTKSLQELRRTMRRLYARRKAIADGAALPFAFTTHYADIGRLGGFDVIIGNPPWVRPHHVPPTARAHFRSTFATVRNAAWKTGASAAKVSPGFGGQTDLAALFLERATDLLAPNGALGLLVPAKLWRSLAGGGIRAFLQLKTQITTLEDLSTAPPTFDAAVYPSIVVARRPQESIPPNELHPCTTTVHTNKTTFHWTAPFNTLPFDTSLGAPWLPIPPHVRSAFDSLSRQGIPLSHSLLGRPYLGVKCGCNAAFIVRDVGGDHAIARVEFTHRTTHQSPATYVERDLLRPLIRGESIRPWSLTPTQEQIIWTHDRSGAPLHELPEHARTTLTPWRQKLQFRSDARHRRRWWSLFRTEAADATLPRVVWSDIGKSPRATVIQAGNVAVPLNSCYVVRAPSDHDALTLMTLINSPIIAAWLATLAEPARGGYHRFLGWTMALLPTPRDWHRATTLLAPLGERALRGDIPSEDELLEATLACYHLAHADVAPLLDWIHQ